MDPNLETSPRKYTDTGSAVGSALPIFQVRAWTPITWKGWAQKLSREGTNMENTNKKKIRLRVAEALSCAPPQKNKPCLNLRHPHPSRLLLDPFGFQLYIPLSLSTEILRCWEKSSGKLRRNLQSLSLVKPLNFFESTLNSFPYWCACRLFQWWDAI